MPSLPWRDWFLDSGVFDLSAPPPAGVFYNRMSASSHTRDHRYAAELTASVLAWLAGHGRRIVNGPRALDLEISKTANTPAPKPPGFRTPKPYWSPAKIISSPRRALFRRRHGHPSSRTAAGKGSGSGCFIAVTALAEYLDGADYEPPVDGLHLRQQYVRAPAPLITAPNSSRRFLYAVEVDTSEGFELSPGRWLRGR